MSAEKCITGLPPYRPCRLGGNETISSLFCHVLRMGGMVQKRLKSKWVKNDVWTIPPRYSTCLSPLILPDFSGEGYPPDFKS